MRENKGPSVLLCDGDIIVVSFAYMVEVRDMAALRPEPESRVWGDTSRGKAESSVTCNKRCYQCLSSNKNDLKLSE